jgi:hypothetical protein
LVDKTECGLADNEMITDPDFEVVLPETFIEDGIASIEVA